MTDPERQPHYRCSNGVNCDNFGTASTEGGVCGSCEAEEGRLEESKITCSNCGATLVTEGLTCHNCHQKQ
jgi:predicted amidophosphoribosyltransferase